jgi:hypothetical protein
LDNPILRAQLRAQLRKKRALGVIQIAGLLSSLIVFVTYSIAGLKAPEAWASAMHATSWLMFVFLYWKGGSYLMQAVSTERESGIFVFLRSSPLSALSVAFGYLVGGASRAYVAALTLALPWVMMGHLSGQGVGTMFAGLFYLALGALTFHSLTLLFALRGQGKLSGTLRFAFIFLYFISDTLSDVGIKTVAHLTPVPAFSALGLTLWGEQVSHGDVLLFGLPLSSFTYTLLIQGLSLCACLWIATRSIEREGQPVVNRSGGLLMWGVTSLLVMGVDLNPSALNQLQALNVSLGYVPGSLTLLLLSLLALTGLLVTSSPSLISFQRASAREARRHGRAPTTRLPWSVEGASLLPFCGLCVTAMCTLVASYLLLHGGYEALKVALRGGVLSSMLSVSVTLFALAGVSEHASALRGRQSYNLTLWVRGLTILLLPLLLALGAHQLQLLSLVELCASLSPLYGVLYAFKALWGPVTTAVNPSELPLFTFSSGYFALSLMVELAVSLWSFRGAYTMKLQLIKSLNATANPTQA